ncbi:MAG TPA: zf-HC2 domain-containing protein [Chloroflexia bacterium]|nr:zf-HC2 domain-containing protein [Chloroflexia bacterium]
MKPTATHCIEEGELRLYLDDALHEVEMESVEGHLAGCAECRDRVEALSAIAGQVKALIPIVSHQLNAQAALERLRHKQARQVGASSLDWTLKPIPRALPALAQRRPEMTRIINRPLRIGLAVAFVIALLALGAVMLFNRPAPVRAAEVLEKAEQAASKSTVQSFHGILYSKHRNSALEEFAESTDERYYLAPKSHRSDAIITSPDGQENRMLWVTDGKKPWGYESFYNQVTLFDPHGPGPNFGAHSLGEFLNRGIGKFFNATLIGTEPVAGRMAYILDMTLKPQSQWPENTYPGPAAHLKMWVDQQAYFILRLEGWDADDNELFTEWYTSFELNGPVDPALFGFNPPPGAKIVNR